MPLRISRKQEAHLIEWAKDAGKLECCGLLLGPDEIVRELVLCKNVAADPSAHFEIDPAVLIAKHKQQRQGGLPILGYFHSHPNGLARPSSDDVMQSVVDGRYWVIVAGDELTAWRPRCGNSGANEFDSVPILVEG